MVQSSRNGQQQLSGIARQMGIGGMWQEGDVEHKEDQCEVCRHDNAATGWMQEWHVRFSPHQARLRCKSLRLEPNGPRRAWE